MSSSRTRFGWRVSAGGCDVGCACSAVQADGEVAEGRHDSRSVSGADLAEVFGEGDVADPVQPVLDAPVGPGRVGEPGWADLVMAQVGDCGGGFRCASGVRSLAAAGG